MKGTHSQAAAAAVPVAGQALTLQELLGYIEQILAHGLRGAVWVRAEIAALTDRRHLYLDLVQLGADGREAAKCRATLWAGERYALEGKFKRATGGGFAAGMQVLLFVTAEFHVQYGFSLNIIDAAPEYTLGEAATRLDTLRQKLAEAGLLEQNRRLKAPAHFTRIALISPPDAAGLGDVRRELDALKAVGLLDVEYLSATFQGQAAQSSLLTTLATAAQLHAQEPLDALLLVRGGGAVTDLAWLNNEALARAVAQFPAPVLTGIGHARDHTLLDDAAHMALDTPSKAAALVLGSVLAQMQQATDCYQSIMRLGWETLRETEQATQRAFEKVSRAAGHRLDTESAALDALMRQVVGLSPASTLKRGYALVRTQAGEPVVSAAQLAPGQRLRLSLQGGEAAIEVLAVEG